MKRKNGNSWLFQKLREKRNISRIILLSVIALFSLGFIASSTALVISLASEPEPYNPNNNGTYTETPEAMDKYRIAAAGAEIELRSTFLAGLGLLLSTVTYSVSNTFFMEQSMWKTNLQSLGNVMFDSLFKTMDIHSAKGKITVKRKGIKYQVQFHENHFDKLSKYGIKSVEGKFTGIYDREELLSLLWIVDSTEI